MARSLADLRKDLEERVLKVLLFHHPLFRVVGTAEGFEANGLKVIALSHVARALFLISTKEEIRRAEDIMNKQVESQVGEARERVIYWYTVKHSDPEEIADVLYRIYTLMIRKRSIYGRT